MARRSIPLSGHRYHDLPDASLRYICKDAGEAARIALDSGDVAAQNKYYDQVNDACTILHYRECLARG